MTLPGNIDLIITGGNSHLVLYKWEKKKLVEVKNEKLKNVIDIKVHKHWFAIRYKKKKTQLYKVNPEKNDEIEGPYLLKMEAVKNAHQSMCIFQFRENQLIIANGHEERHEGSKLFLEMFNMETRETTDLQEYELDGHQRANAIVYSTKYALLIVATHNSVFYSFKILPNQNNENKFEISFFEKKFLYLKGEITRMVKSADDRHIVACNSRGNIIISEVSLLNFEIKLKTKGHLTDIVLYTRNGNAFMYAPDFIKKIFIKVSFEEGLGKLLMDREHSQKQPFIQGK
jgi:hypothetical protein